MIAGSSSSCIAGFPSILKVLTIIQPETLVALAQGRLSLLLGVGSRAPRGGATADRHGDARVDPGG